ncbi:MAG: hypothetical protein ACRCZF_03225, partial [Gemmataceae bacterium]
MRSLFFALLLILGGIPGTALAQIDRFELGRRLKLMEQTWETQTEAARRKAALAGLPKATQQFFSFQLGEAGRTLDTARYALLPEPPSEAQRWAETLMVIPESRLVDRSTPTLKVTVRPFYSVAPPAGELP